MIKENMIKVHAIGESGYNNQLHDVAHIRLFLPLQLLADEGQILLTKDVSYEGYEESDVFIIQRTWSYSLTINKAETFIKMIKLKNKKLIYEIDDNLLDNQNIMSLSKKIIYLLAKNADMIITSTPELKKRFLNISNNIIVISNFLDSRLLYERRNVFRKNEKIIIGYMGTATHQKDFHMIKLPLMRVLQKYKSKICLEIVGSLEDESVIQFMPNTSIKILNKVKDYFSFWEWMNNNCFWDIGIAPLKYSEFTKCKSDIKYLDYSALGIAGIYSNHPAYENSIKDRETGLLVDNNCDSWQIAIEELIRNDELRNSIRNSAHNDLWKNRILQNNVNLWLDVINK